MAGAGAGRVLDNLVVCNQGKGGDLLVGNPKAYTFGKCFFMPNMDILTITKHVVDVDNVLTSVLVWYMV